MAFKNEIGNKYGRLTVIRRATEEYPRGNGKHVMWYCKCDCGSLTKPIPTNYLISGHTSSCGCNKLFADKHASKGEEKITQLLNRAKISFIREYMFDNLRGNAGTHLRYDFAIFKDSKLFCLCEFDGIQHFKQIKAFQPHRDDFKRTQGHDRQKNSYALAHNIPLYRIPYWELDNLSSIQDIFTENHRVKSKYHNDDLTPP